MLRDRHLIVFGEDFNRHPHCLEHLVRRLIPFNRVLWVETIGMRSPKLSIYDLKRVWQKLGTWFRRSTKSTGGETSLPANLSLISPLMIPYNRYRLIRKLNRFLVVRSVKKAMRVLAFQQPILLTSIPSTCDFIDHLGEALSIYYCVDEFSLWPGIDPGVIGPMERELISKVDLVLTTSDALFEAKQKLHPGTELLTHGVDVEHFRVLGEARGNRKKVGFFGLIDERVDRTLLLALSKRFPSVEFHFIGEVVVELGSLHKQQNLIWHGKLSYDKLPEAIQDYSLFILPYLVNELTRFINPLKIKEYLATGRPVVTTSLKELERFQDVVWVARDYEGFFRGVSDVLEERRAIDSHLIERHLKGQSWDDKAEWLSQRVNSLPSKSK